MPARKWRMLSLYALIAIGCCCLDWASEARCQEADTLRAVMEIGGKNVFHRPLAVKQGSDGQLYVLDSGNNRIVVCDRYGSPIGNIGVIGSGPGEFNAPNCFDLDAASRIYVADTDNKRIQVLDKKGEFIRQIPVGFPIQWLAVSQDGTIFAQADPEKSDKLINVLGGWGETVKSLGDKIGKASDPDHIATALNRLCMACDARGRLLVGMSTVPRIMAYDATGGELCAFDVMGPELQDMRKNFFFQSYKEALQRAHRQPNEDPSRRDFIDEVRAVCADGQPHGAYYISGIGGYGEYICALVYGWIYIYDDSGELLRRVCLRGSDGSEIYSHRMWLSADGSLFTIDMAFRHKCYKFIMPASWQSPEGRGVQETG